MLTSISINDTEYVLVFSPDAKILLTWLETLESSSRASKLRLSSELLSNSTRQLLSETFFCLIFSWRFVT